ncbi:MAG: lipopolysaccharide biosynthesis protein [Anaerolineales bacterium]|nr:lipopolysaccharide biosynthesis protein [Anaerolineales bacterium]
MSMSVSQFLTRLKKWGIKGSLSVLDHGLQSGANFILSVLLARWLLGSHYGSYSIAFAVYQFVYQVHNATILEPMSVLGPARMQHRLADYLRDQIRLHFVISILAGLVICIIGVVVFVFNQVLGRVLITMGIALSFILLPLLMRRGFYLFRRPGLAFLGSTIYALFLCGQLWILKISGYISVDLAFPIIGLAGLVSGLCLVKQIPPRQAAVIPAGVTWSNNWQYGQWLVYSSLLIALASQVQTLVVGAFLGLSDAGAFRALQNFVQPIILSFAALSAYLLPVLSSDFGTGNISGLKQKGKYLLVLFLVISVGFELFLLAYASNLESILYDGRFSPYVYLIPVWGLVPIVAVSTYVYYFLLQSIQRPRAILLGSVIWSATSTILALAFSLKWGILGATVSVIAGYLAAGIAFAALYRIYIAEPNDTGVNNVRILDKKNSTEHFPLE